MSKTSGSRLGELMTIRDILMGEIIEEYNGRFEELEKKLAEQNSRFEEKDTQLNKRVTDLQKELDDKHSKLMQALENNSANDKALIGDLFVKIGEELNGLKK